MAAAGTISTSKKIAGIATTRREAVNYLGMFCVGAFISGLCTLGIQFVVGDNGFVIFEKLLATVFSGAVMAFVKQFRESKALGAYGVGLLVAFLWAYVGSALHNIQDPRLPLQIVGWLHLTASTVASLVAARLFLPPAFRDVARS